MNSDTPRVTVIIPTYGRPRFLNEALESVLAQSYSAHEIIVVDDCSPEPIKLPPHIQERVHLIRHARNQGAGAARNTGLAHATGELVIFLDDDDRFTPDRLRIAVEGIGDAPMHAMARAKFKSGASPHWVGGPVFKGDLRQSFPYGGAAGDHPRMGQVAHRRSTLLQFDPTLRRAQDTEWWIRMGDSADFTWSDEVGVEIRVHDEARPQMSFPLLLEVRRQIAHRHVAAGNGTQRSALQRSVAIAALRAGRPLQSIAWSTKSFFSQPHWGAVKIIMRASAWIIGLRSYPSREAPAPPDTNAMGGRDWPFRGQRLGTASTARASTGAPEVGGTP